MRTMAAIVVFIMMSYLVACSNHRDEVHVNSYDQDDRGYMRITQANPNLPTSPTYHSYSKDTRLIKQTLHKINGIKSMTIMINGPSLVVRITPKRGQSKQQLARLQARAARQLETMMPRYQVQVLLNK